MRFLPIAVALLCGVAAAQEQRLEIYPGVTQFTSRGNVGTASGEIHQGLHASHWRAIGDDGTKCTIVNMFTVQQDQNRGTPETFNWIFRKGTDAAGPGVTSADVISRIGPFNLPASTGTGAIAWGLTTALTAAQHVTVPCDPNSALPNADANWSFGMDYPPSPLWTADGQSTHITLDTGQGSAGNQGDHAWQVLLAATAATHPSNRRTWRFAAQVPGAILQMGNGVGQYGMGGLYPATAAPFSARALYPASVSGGQSLLWIAFDRVLSITRGAPLFPNTARLHLGQLALQQISAVAITGGSATASAQAIHALTPNLPGISPNPPATIDLFWQAVGFKGGVIHMTNQATSTHN